MKLTEEQIYERVRSIPWSRWDEIKEFFWARKIAKQLGLYDEGTYPIEYFLKKFKTREKAFRLILHTMAYEITMINCRINAKEGAVHFWIEENGGGYLFLEGWDW